MARTFKALGDEVRLRIVALLSHGELCVCHVQTALGLTQPNASRHLGILRAAGLVTYERRDKWAYYRIAPQADAGCQGQLDRLIATIADQASLRKDIARLRKSIRPGACK